MIKNMKIRSKMLISYAIIISIFLAAGVTSLFMMKNLGSSLTSFYESSFTVTVDAWSARRNMMATRAYIMQSMLETDSEKNLEYLEKARVAMDEVNSKVPVIKERFNGDKKLVEQLESITADVKECSSEIFDLSEKSENTKAYRLAKEKYIPYMDQMAETLLEISTVADNNANDLVEKSHKGITVSVAIILALMVVCVAAAVILAILISKSITKPVTEIKQAAKNLSDGKLDTTIIYESQDELGSLADSVRITMKSMKSYIRELGMGMEKMAQGDLNVKPGDDFKGDFMLLRDNMLTLVTSLNEMLTQINRSAEQVSGGSEQVSAGAQSLSQGAAKQASSVEDMASIFNEISENISENAKNAANVSSIVSDMGSRVTKCNSQMEGMVLAIDNISKKSDEIGKIIKIIEDIAFQTNILALNAAVEAARAGTAGRGFMVVADEVRSLAAKSREASQSTAKLINESSESVENGRNIAHAAADAMQQVVEGAETAVDSINLIAHSTEEQAGSVYQATKGMEDISDIVQTNSATAEESAAASEELSAQANMLKEMVRGFKLREDT